MPKRDIRRTKTGCATCKQRKIKCDETRPVCNRCKSSGKHCTGFSVEIRDGRSGGRRAILPNQAAVPLTTIQPYARPIAATCGGTTAYGLDTGPFDFFRSRAAPELGAQNSADFWLRIVLQACHTEEAVWHAAAAFGLMHRVYRDQGTPTLTGPSDSEIQKSAYGQYHKAVTSLRSKLAKQDSQSMGVALITCVLLICFDLISNRYKAALTHLKSGLWILDDTKTASERRTPDPTLNLPDLEKRLGKYTIDEELHEPFQLLEVQAIFFGIRRLRHPEWPQASVTTSKPLPAEGFKSIEEARSQLEHLVECISKFIVSADDDYEPLPVLPDNPAQRSEQQQLKLRLKAWYASADRLLHDPTRMTDFDVTSLHIHYYCDWILLSTCLDKGWELSFDRFTPEFQQIVDLASICMDRKIPSFSIQYGIIPGLYYTAMKCRDPLIRRRAIGLLSSSARREGMWESKTAAQKATWLMMQEEGGLDEVVAADQVPEHFRIHQSMLVPRKGEQPVVVFRRRKHETDGSWVMFNAGTGEEFIAADGEYAVDMSHWKLYALPASPQKLETWQEYFRVDGRRRMELFTS